MPNQKPDGQLQKRAYDDYDDKNYDDDDNNNKRAGIARSIK